MTAPRGAEGAGTEGAGLREALAEAKCPGCDHYAAWHGQMSGCDCYPDGGVVRCQCPLTHADALMPTVERIVAERVAEEIRRAREEALGPVVALVDAEVSDQIESTVRSEVAGVRCLDCNLRYEERQEYGCHETGRGHHYDPDELTDAEREARQDPVEYVTLKVTDLRAALGGGAREGAADEYATKPDVEDYL